MGGGRIGGTGGMGGSPWPQGGGGGRGGGRQQRQPVGKQYLPAPSSLFQPMCDVCFPLNSLPSPLIQAPILLHRRRRRYVARRGGPGVLRSWPPAAA